MRHMATLALCALLAMPEGAVAAPTTMPATPAQAESAGKAAKTPSANATRPGTANATLPAPASGPATAPASAPTTGAASGMPSTSESEVYRLDPLRVSGETQQMGKTVIDGEKLNSLPSPGRTINDALRTRSDVQFDEGAYSSTQGGEIRPPRVSIAGSRPYENSYVIGGISTANRIDASGEDRSTTDGTAPTGEAQSFYIDTDLLDGVTLFNNNIPAEYGGFTGGMVKADIRDPRMDGVHGFLKYRHTRDNWAHITAPDMPSGTTKVDKQDRFQRHDGSVAVEGPLSERLGVILNYSVKHSVIPMETAWGSPKDQYRTNENFISKLAFMDDGPFKGSFTLGYAPYQREMYISSRLDSDFSVDGGGFFTALDGTYDFGPVAWKNTLGFSRSEVSRYGTGDVTSTWLRYKTIGGSRFDSAYATWGSGTTASEGSMGDYEQSQDETTWKSILDFDPVHTGILSHVFQTGIEVLHMDAAAESTGYTTYYSPSIPNSQADRDKIPAGPGNIEGEQFAQNKTVQDAYSRSASVNSYAWFGQDTIEIGRLTLRPGLRVSHDDLTGNIDPAWRFMADLDVFDDDVVHLIGGANRYYGSQMLAYALRKNTEMHRYKRSFSGGKLGDWVYDKTTGGKNYNLDELDTPYADELMGGITLKALDTRFGMRAESRKHRDQLRTALDANGDTTLNNSGKTDYWGVTWTVERDFNTEHMGDHTVELGITRSNTKSDGTDFDSSFLNGDTGSVIEWEKVYFEGSLMPRSNLPASNYNRPWVGTLTHTARFMDDDALRWFNVLRNKGPGTDLVRTGTFTDTDGLRYDAYEARTFSDSVTVDTAVEWDALRHEDHVLTLTMEVSNLFDQKSNVDSSTGYVMGRQYYAGFKYTF